MVEHQSAWLVGMPELWAITATMHIVIAVQTTFIWKLAFAPRRAVALAAAWYVFVLVLACLK